ENTPTKGNSVFRPCRTERSVVRNENRLSSTSLDLTVAKWTKCAVAEAFFEKIAIDRLSSDCAIAGSDNHLAIGRRHTPCIIQSRDVRALAFIDQDLPIFIQDCAELSREVIVEDVAARGKETIGQNFLAIGEGKVFQMTGVMLDVHDFLDVN